MNEHDTGSVSAPTGARDPGQRRTKIRRALVALVASLVAILVVAAGPASPASAFSWRSEWRVGGTSGWTSANVAPAAVGYGPNFRMITAPGFTFARNGSVGRNDFQRYLVTFDLYAGYSTNNMTLYAHRTFDSFFNPGQGALTFSGVVLDYYVSRGTTTARGRHGPVVRHSRELGWPSDGEL